MNDDYNHASDTIVISDLHLADAEPPHPKNPLWKRYKRPRFFMDRSFRKFLEYIDRVAANPIELVFNGDIFDFDSVMAIPEDLTQKVSWLEKLRGLSSDETKSRFKMKIILDDHPIWVEALRDFLLRGHRVIFVIGNHDMELHWPSVRKDILKRLALSKEGEARVRFCEWFYISNKDTLIEHGNQYDSYCLCANPINPLIRKGSKIQVRIPFGNLAGKYILNGMGLMNPHADSSFIKNSLWEYLVFYYKYVVRTQPFILWTWFWSAFITLLHSLADGFLPALSDPLTIDDRVADIAHRSNASPRIVWSLKELHVHPAIFNPLKIMRELWLDRAMLLAFIVFIGFEFFTIINVFVKVSFWWFIVPVALLMPTLIFYARSVQSEISMAYKKAMMRVPVSAKIATVGRVIQGHTHLEKHQWIDGVEYLNTGTWSPAYRDVECTQPYGRKCFAWIKPGNAGSRSAELYEWKDGSHELIPVSTPPS